MCDGFTRVTTLSCSGLQRFTLSFTASSLVSLTTGAIITAARSGWNFLTKLTMRSADRSSVSFRAWVDLRTAFAACSAWTCLLVVSRGFTKWMSNKCSRPYRRRDSF